MSKNKIDEENIYFMPNLADERDTTMLQQSSASSEEIAEALEAYQEQLDIERLEQLEREVERRVREHELKAQKTQRRLREFLARNRAFLERD